MKNSDQVLILAPHTDDGEFGCGATIAKLLEQGKEVFYAAFSSCDESLPDSLPKGTLAKELKQATSVLGIPEKNVLLYKFEVRKFPENRQAILEEMVKLNREIKPSLVFLPSKFDTHQDHNTISEEGFRAFKNTSLLGYEVPWNNLNFTTNCFFYINEAHLQKKIKALQCYESQSHRRYASEEFIRSLAVTRGVQIGADFAEAFEAIRWIEH